MRERRSRRRRRRERERGRTTRVYHFFRHDERRKPDNLPTSLEEGDKEEGVSIIIKRERESCGSWARERESERERERGREKGKGIFFTVEKEEKSRRRRGRSDDPYSRYQVCPLLTHSRALISDVLVVIFNVL